MNLTWRILMLGGAVVVASCVGLPETTRTGQIHTVKIEESLSPADLNVRSGDEVRWVNHRSLPVTVEFVNLPQKVLACQHGFSGFFGIRENASVKPNESVSLCFTGPGKVTYNVRMQSALPGGQDILAGAVQVGQASNR